MKGISMQNFPGLLHQQRVLLQDLLGLFIQYWDLGETRKVDAESSGWLSVRSRVLSLEFPAIDQTGSTVFFLGCARLVQRYLTLLTILTGGLPGSLQLSH